MRNKEETHRKGATGFFLCPLLLPNRATRRIAYAVGQAYGAIRNFQTIFPIPVLWYAPALDVNNSQKSIDGMSGFVVQLEHKY